ncbi:MAG: adenylyl-sulfate kinase [Candidatus Marinimicrobia bacterium]|jgi:adenylylsulfate kinase|nr:adenylyl-sulfate kinase [Candidatus Neomarinimicrobiota bacterium]
MYKETHARSVIKSISWRFWASLTTIALVLLFVGEIKAALSVGITEVVAKLILYFFHERTWDKIRFGKKEIQPLILWFTGLSGSGKSTLSEAVYKELMKKDIKTERLDGDTVRDIFPKTGFTKIERNEHIKRVGYLASRMEKNGIFVVASFVSPYKESREFVRDLCDNFIEIYISTPIEICEKRDTKGLYKKARNGEIENFTGVNDPYEEPQNPEITIDTSKLSIEKATKKVMKYINNKM